MHGINNIALFPSSLRHPFTLFHYPLIIIMGNTNSCGDRRRPSAWRTHPSPLPPPHPHRANIYVFAAASPYPNPYPYPNANPNPSATGYYPYPPPMHPGYYPAPPLMPLPGPTNWAAAGPDGRYPIPYGPPMMPPLPSPPYVEHQKAVTIRNDVNIKETLRVEPDHDNPGQYLVAFTFDATVPASITVMFFAKEGEDCKLMSTVESLIPPVTVHFQRRLGQKFRQPSGTGIDFSRFDVSDLLKLGEGNVCPLAVKAEACVVNPTEKAPDDNPVPGSTESQITQVVFDKEGDEYKVKVLKQILWANKTRYELQEIIGIGNSMEGEMDGNESLKKCVICLNEPWDTTVLPCRHMVVFASVDLLRTEVQSFLTKLK